MLLMIPSATVGAETAASRPSSQEGDSLPSGAWSLYRPANSVNHKIPIPERLLEASSEIAERL